MCVHGQTEKQTDRLTYFLLQILTPRGPKRREKSFSLIGKKVDIDPIAIYVRGAASGHIKTFLALKIPAIFKCPLT